MREIKSTYSVLLTVLFGDLGVTNNLAKLIFKFCLFVCCLVFPCRQRYHFHSCQKNTAEMPQYPLKCCFSTINWERCTAFFTCIYMLSFFLLIGSVGQTSLLNMTKEETFANFEGFFLVLLFCSLTSALPFKLNQSKFKSYLEVVYPQNKRPL